MNRKQLEPKTTLKLAADVDALRSRIEEHGDDVRFSDSLNDDDRHYSIEDAAALLEQAYELLNPLDL
jgi:hypothetical protein